jgi:hypothetical protein
VTAQSPIGCKKPTSAASPVAARAPSGRLTPLRGPATPAAAIKLGDYKSKQQMHLSLDMSQRSQHRHTRPIFAGLGLAAALLLGGCAGPKYTVDDGRPVNPVLLEQIGHYGRGEQALRPAIARSAALKDPECDRQWELPFAVATSQGWSEADRVAWVRALGVDERLTVVATTPDSPLRRGDHITDVAGYTSDEATDLLERLGRLRDRGEAFEVNGKRGQPLRVQPFEVCRGYTRLAPPNTPELQDYHWLMSYHPLELARAEPTADEALWAVLWTQGVSEEGGARMKTYHYGTSLLSSLYTVATLASGLKGAAMAAEAAVKTAQSAAASVASEVLKQQLIDQAKSFAANRVREQVGKSVQALTQAQVVAGMQQLAANRGLLGGISRVAATVFDQADAWAYARMQQLGANPMAGFTLHQKMLERGLLTNALAFDPERMDSIQALAEKDGRRDQLLAILKGIRPEALDFDGGDMPLASAPQAFSYEETASASSNPYAHGLVEAMLGMNAPALPTSR